MLAFAQVEASATVSDVIATDQIASIGGSGGCSGLSAWIAPK